MGPGRICSITTRDTQAANWLATIYKSLKIIAGSVYVVFLDNTLLAEQAEQLTSSIPLSPEAFEWYQVSKKVNKVGKNGEHLISPI